ncbi:HdeD family acid-resistance protein [Candidatus Stoquefichus sp. SB1]|jgi:uncharacterized membrane protein HdeD (DUF308 family)|uniref:HdeD family acid-resistance protein n=1 Tax=Candidatus Stoquefichus sp. SB1 TaxID=1658109 RepID=UPI0009E42F0F|nr:DUF308 domain-containing protein [Candidatus Stoquefichus sp. SB1]
MMLDLLQGLKKGVVLYSIIAIVMGFILILFPDTTSQVICYGVAAIIFICGLVNFVRYFSNDFSYRFGYDLISGFLLCAIGVFMMIRSDIVIMMIPFVIGIFIVVEGVMNIIRSFQLKRWGFERWIYDLILALLLFLLGCIVVFNPFDAAMMSVIFMGVCLIYDGLLNLIILHRSNQFAKMLREY